MSNVTLLKIQCDDCGAISPTVNAKEYKFGFYRLRMALVKQGWKITASRDYCPMCGKYGKGKNLKHNSVFHIEYRHEVKPSC